MEKMAVSKSKFEECDEDTKAKFNALEGVRHAVFNMQCR